MKVRRISKLLFALIATYTEKTEAQDDAENLRKGGYNARVIKSGKSWQVWREVA